MSNKDLLYSTGNYIQYLLIIYNRKESGKKMNYFAIYLKLTQYCKSAILKKYSLGTCNILGRKNL